MRAQDSSKDSLKGRPSSGALLAPDRSPPCPTPLQTLMSRLDSSEKDEQSPRLSHHHLASLWHALTPLQVQNGLVALQLQQCLAVQAHLERKSPPLTCPSQRSRSQSQHTSPQSESTQLPWRSEQQCVDLQQSQPLCPPGARIRLHPHPQPTQLRPQKPRRSVRPPLCVVHFVRAG